MILLSDIKVGYITGPLRPSVETGRTREEHIAIAEEEARRWFDRGFSIICPHTQSRTWHTWVTDVSQEDKFVVQVDLPIIRRVDFLVALPNFAFSTGSLWEMHSGMAWDKRILVCTDDPDEYMDYIAIKRGDHSRWLWYDLLEVKL